MADVEPIYREIASKMVKEQNRTLPRVIKKVANLEQARILRELPNTAEAVSKKLGLDQATVERDLQYLFERGLATFGRHKGWSLVNNVVLVKDLVGSANPKYDDIELFDLLHEMSLEDSDDLAERVKRGEKVPPVIPVMRVLPKWRTVKDIPGLLPVEDVREIFKNPPIVVHNCPCRVVYRSRPCKGTVPVDICLAVGSNGRSFLRRGAGKEITYDEVIALLDKLEEAFPLVSTAGNSNTMPNILCSCCNDCCGLFVKAARTKPVLGKVPYAKSRFVVEDDPDECTACGICTDNRCPVGAITMKDFPELGGERSYTNVDECIGCGLCVLTCPNDARKMKLVRPPEHITDPASIFDALTD